MTSEDSSNLPLTAVKHVTASVAHPRLDRLDTESIHAFLQRYDSFSKEIKARAEQMITTGAITADVIRPMSLKLCSDAEQLESSLDLRLIERAASYDELTDDVLRNYLDSKCEQPRSQLSALEAEALVKKYLHMDLFISCARSRMELLFLGYSAMLRRNGLKWILEKNPNTAVSHILYVIKPYQLRAWLESDLSFGHAELNSDFKEFMKHYMKISDAFEKVDVGPQPSRSKNRSANNKDTNNTGSVSDSRSLNRKKDRKPRHVSEPFVPFCPFHVCRKHWIRDCPEDTDGQKVALKAERAAQQMRDGPSKSTRGQLRFKSDAAAADGIVKHGGGGAAGRLNKDTPSESSSFQMMVSNVKASVEAIGRCDDGSDSSIVSPKLVERAQSLNIGIMREITPVVLSVALIKGENLQSFRFSSSWTVPRTTLHPSIYLLA